VSNTAITFWAVGIGALFAYLWWQGQIRRFATYCQETWVELLKCSWPTWGELRGSTVLIAICIALLGVFTTVLDLLFNQVLSKWL
jgi:preprotein translocase subunit SecE